MHIESQTLKKSIRRESVWEWMREKREKEEKMNIKRSGIQRKPNLLLAFDIELQDELQVWKSSHTFNLLYNPSVVQYAIKYSMQ